MTGGENFVYIVAMAGWLILALSAFAAYRLSWKRGAVMALIWAVIIAAVAGFMAMVRGGGF